MLWDKKSPPEEAAGKKHVKHHLVATGTPKMRNHTVTKKAKVQPRKNKRRALGHDRRMFYFIDEVADITGTSERTILRDIDDGLLIATYFRGAIRIADDDLNRYLRQQRGPRQLMKRRRSPRTKTHSENTG